MPLPSGLSGQAGFAIESTYGVFVTPTVFTPMISESLEGDPDRIESQGIIAGARVLKSAQWAPGSLTVGGDFQTELYDRNMGIHARGMFGGYSVSGSGPYTHTFTPGELPSLSGQFGMPAIDGVVHPKNETGLKVASWELGCKAGEIATLGLTYVGQNELIGSRVVTDGVLNSSTTVTSATAVFSQADVGKVIAATGITSGTTIVAVASATSVTLSAAATATATSVTVTVGSPLASASYASGAVPFVFTGASLTFGGASAHAQECTLKGDNGLSDRRPELGTPLTREFLPADLRTYSADVVADFDSLASWTAFRSGAEAAMVFAFAAGSNSFTITLNVRYDKAATNVAGKGILQKAITVKAVGSTTDASAITGVMVNGDTTYA